MTSKNPTSKSFKKHLDMLKAYTSLPDHKAHHHLKNAVGGDLEDDVDDTQFLTALFLARDDEDITEQALAQSLLRHAFGACTIQVDGQQVRHLLKQNTNPQRVLDLMKRQGLLTSKQHGIVVFHMISKLGARRAETYLIPVKGDLMQALKQARKVNEVDGENGNIAAFCVLTELGPIKARAVGAGSNLLNAIRSVRTEIIAAFGRDSYESQLIQAELIEWDVTAKDVVQEIEDAKWSAKTNEDAYPAARRSKIIKVFRQETGCEDNYQPDRILRMTAGNVGDAIRVYRNENMQPLTLAKVGTMDTASPPYVEPKTIILGLLGTVDRDAPLFTASPKGDGWFVSDFFLWKHVLRGMGSSQTWVTCLDPENLVRKYCSGHVEAEVEMPGTTVREKAIVSWPDGFVQGAPTENRVVVLDQQMLPFAKQDLRIFEEKKLLDEYLKLVESAFKSAQANDRPVLLLMVSHGDIENASSRGGLLIGIHNPAFASKNDFLTADKIETLHRKYPKVRLSLFMTSCFSGNWVTTRYFEATASINVMAATRLNEESHSWEESTSCRHAGGIYTSGFLAELKREPSTPANVTESREYMEFIKDCAARCEKITNPAELAMGNSSLPMFTTTATHEQFWQRTGYDLIDYQKNFDRLRKIPASAPAGNTPPSSQTGSYGRSNKGLRSAVVNLICLYNSSYPSRTNMDKELESSMFAFKQGKVRRNEELRVLHTYLAFRLGMHDLAQLVVNFMNLSLASPIHSYDPAVLRSTPYRDRHSEVVGRLKQTKWFDGRTKDDGLPDKKPYAYVAHAMMLHKATNAEVDKYIRVANEKLEQKRATGSKRVREGGTWNELMAKKRKQKRGSLSNIEWKAGESSKDGARRA